MTAGDRVRQRTGWPPERPTGRKPDFSEPNAAEWRYQRYRYDAYKDGRGPDDIIPFDRWKRRYFEPAAKGSRPGRPGGKAHQDDVARNNEPNRLNPGRIGRNYPDGIGQPGQTVTIRGHKIVPRRGGRVIVEADHFYTDGTMPISRARTKIRAIRRAEPRSTIVVTNVDRPDAPPLVYPPGTQAPPRGPLPRGTKPIIAYP